MHLTNVFWLRIRLCVYIYNHIHLVWSDQIAINDFSINEDHFPGHASRDPLPRPHQRDAPQTDQTRSPSAPHVSLPRHGIRVRWDSDVIVGVAGEELRGGGGVAQSSKVQLVPQLNSFHSLIGTRFRWKTYWLRGCVIPLAKLAFVCIMLKNVDAPSLECCLSLREMQLLAKYLFEIR